MNATRNRSTRRGIYVGACTRSLLPRVCFGIREKHIGGRESGLNTARARLVPDIPPGTVSLAGH